MKDLKRKMIVCFIIWGLIGFNIANLVHIFTNGADAASVVVLGIIAGIGVAIGIGQTIDALWEAEILELKSKAVAVLELLENMESEDDEKCE